MEILKQIKDKKLRAVLERVFLKYRLAFEILAKEDSK
jgi:hypothetical protein